MNASLFHETMMSINKDDYEWILKRGRRSFLGVVEHFQVSSGMFECLMANILAPNTPPLHTHIHKTANIS